MPLNIVLCSDGTGNRGGKERGTNVWNLYCAIDRRSVDPRQIAFHVDGVGTSRFKPLRALGGACGWGITRNGGLLYKYLVRNYRKGKAGYGEPAQTGRQSDARRFFRAGTVAASGRTGMSRRSYGGDIGFLCAAIAMFFAAPVAAAPCGKPDLDVAKYDAAVCSPRSPNPIAPSADGSAVTIYSKCRHNWTGLLLTKGRRYRLEIVPESIKDWCDASHPVGDPMRGFKPEGIADTLMFGSVGLLRRTPWLQWFQLIGATSDKMESAFALCDADKSHDCSAVTVEPKRTGELTLFVNDLPYANNVGEMKIVIRPAP